MQYLTLDVKLIIKQFVLHIDLRKQLILIYLPYHVYAKPCLLKIVLLYVQSILQNTQQYIDYATIYAMYATYYLHRHTQHKTNNITILIHSVLVLRFQSPPLVDLAISDSHERFLISSLSFQKRAIHGLSTYIVHLSRAMAILVHFIMVLLYNHKTGLRVLISLFF